MKTVLDLKIAEKGTIKEVDVDTIPVKLIEMGCVPGNTIEIIRKAPFGGPLYLNINDSFIAIRRGTANEILIED